MIHLSTELFLAWKYFKPKRSAVSVITLISVIGVALGVCVLIVVLAVMTGFTDQLKNKLLETGAHAQVHKRFVFSIDDSREQTLTIHENDAEEMVEQAKKMGADAIPVLVSPVLTQVNDSFNPKGIIAFNPDDMDIISKRIQIEDKVIKGHFPLRKNQIAISTVIANEFNIRLGDKVLLHSPSKLARLIKKDESGRYAASNDAQYYLPSEFTVSVIFKFGKYDFDKNVMFVCLDDADELFGIQWGDATHLYIWTEDPFHMDDFMTKYNQYLQKNKPGAILQSWQDIHQQILGVLSVEKNMMFFLLIFIVLVAAFSITNTLITTVIQKTKEIGLLKSMGATSGSILRIFLLQGLFVGCIGTALGVCFGVLVVSFRMNILEFMRRVSGQQIFPEEVYIFDKLPAHIVWGDVAAICVISIILCTAGALIPAFRAAKLDPAKALRYE